MELFNIGDTVYHKAGDTPPMTVVSLEKMEKGYRVICRWQWYVNGPPQERAFPDRVLTKEQPSTETSDNGSERDPSAHHE